MLDEELLDCAEDLINDADRFTNSTVFVDFNRLINFNSRPLDNLRCDEFSQSSSQDPRRNSDQEAVEMLDFI